MTADRRRWVNGKEAKGGPIPDELSGFSITQELMAVRSSLSLSLLNANLGRDQKRIQVEPHSTQNQE